MAPPRPAPPPCLIVGLIFSFVKMTTLPELPARPTLPARWMKSTAFLGSSQSSAVVILGEKSIPRESIPVVTSTLGDGA